MTKVQIYERVDSFVARALALTVDMKTYMENCQKLDADVLAFDRSLGKGVKVGRIIRTPIADGYAMYFIVGLTKSHAKLVHFPIGDAWTSPAVSRDGLAPRYFVDECIRRGDGFRKIFAGTK